MLRIALSLYLAFALLAGPALCCCTLVRTAGAIARIVSPPQIGHSEDACSCCKHSQDRDDSEGPRKQDSPSEEPCPCQGTTPQLAAAPGGQQLTSDEVGIVLVLPMAFLAPSADRVSTSVGIDFSHSVDEPFHSAQDLLRVMHFLRC